MNTIVNGGSNDSRFAFRVGGDTPRDVEAASLVNGQVVITDTGTVAQVGDFFRATEGPLAFQEIAIVAVSTNSITIATTTLPLVNDDFYVMREVTQRTDDSGAQTVVTTSGPIQFVLDSVDTEVEEDTGTPANSIPLPVKVLDGSGLVPDFATSAKQDAQTALLTTIDSDTSALAGTVSGSEIQVDIVASLPAGTNNIGDVDIASAIPAGANIIGVVGIDQSTPGTTNGVQVVASLPAGTNNIGDVDIASAIPAGTNIIGVVGIDQTTPGTTNGVQVVAALPAGTNNIGDVDIASALPAGTNNIGDVDVLTLPVAFDAGASSATTQRVVIATDQTSIPIAVGGKSVSGTVRNDYTATSVTTGAWVELISSTSAAATEMEIFDSSGQTLEIGTGAAMSETRLILVFPGGNGRVPVAIPASTRISIRAVSATASVGELDINLYN